MPPLHVRQHGSRGLPLTLRTMTPLRGRQILRGTIDGITRTKIGPVSTMRYQRSVLSKEEGDNRTASDSGGVMSAKELNRW